MIETGVNAILGRSTMYALDAATGEVTTTWGRFQGILGLEMWDGMAVVVRQINGYWFIRHVYGLWIS